MRGYLAHPDGGRSCPTAMPSLADEYPAEFARASTDLDVGSIAMVYNALASGLISLR